MAALMLPIRSRLVPALLAAALLAAGGASALERQADPKAREALREVYEKRETWDAEFPGFEARLRAQHGGREHRGAARVQPDLRVEVTLEEPAAAAWAREALASIVSHRRPAPFASGDGRHPLTFGPPDDHPAGRLIQLNDGMDSSYRVRDGQLMQINRSAGPRLRFTIDMVEYVATGRGTYLPRTFSVAYFRADNGELIRTETFRDDYARVGRYHLPAARRQVTAESGGTRHALLALEDVRLLR